MRHDRDDHRLTVGRELEAELRPRLVVAIDEQHPGVERRRRIDPNASEQGEICVRRTADESRRVRHGRASGGIGEPVGRRAGLDRQLPAVERQPAGRRSHENDIGSCGS